jgi:hypothetical protein
MRNSNIIRDGFQVLETDKAWSKKLANRHDDCILSAAVVPEDESLPERVSVHHQVVDASAVPISKPLVEPTLIFPYHPMFLGIHQVEAVVNLVNGNLE